MYTVMATINFIAIWIKRNQPLHKVVLDVDAYLALISKRDKGKLRPQDMN